MTLTQTFAPRQREAAERPAIVVPSPGSPVAAADLARILDDLVDAIDIREAYEPEVAGWDTAAAIRRLERELAHAWAAAPHSLDRAQGARRWQP